MVMPFEVAWAKLVAERVDTTSEVVRITKSDIESTTGNELRLMAKMDSSADVPAALGEHGYFVVPSRNGEYLLVRGRGYHVLEPLPPPITFRPQLDFDLTTLRVGDSESQHLDYCFNVGLIEHFARAKGLRQTIRGRKRMPAIRFHVGSIGPLEIEAGVQVEVDLGCEGRNEVILIEAKIGRPTDFHVRQVYFPYRMWRAEIPAKRIRPCFFCTETIAGRRMYHFWEYAFEDDEHYDSLRLVRAESFSIEPVKIRLTVAELLRAHHAPDQPDQPWSVPQADTFSRVAELPLLVAQGIKTARAVAAYYRFDARQSSYYRQAAEFLGLLDSRSGEYALTPLGQAYVELSADERRSLLAGILVQFPPIRAVLALTQRQLGQVTKAQIAELIARHSEVSSSTPQRRASTIVAWLHWLETATGAVRTTQLGLELAE